MRLDEPLTFVQAAQAIKWRPDRNGSYKPSARRLLRLALRREREMGRRFVIRDRAGHPFQITLGALTRYLPELRPSRVDALAASLRPLLLEVERRAREIVAEKIDEEVEPELQKLHDRDEEIAKEVESLALALAVLTGSETAGEKTAPNRTTLNHVEPNKAARVKAPIAAHRRSSQPSR